MKMTNMIKDGWHVICGYDVYVENGFIVRGIKEDYNRSPVAAYPYRRCRRGGWDQDNMSVDAFRSGVKRGTVCMF